MANFTPEHAGPRPGAKVVFWAWMIVVVIGLAFMIALPLTGR